MDISDTLNDYYLIYKPSPPGSSIAKASGYTLLCSVCYLHCDGVMLEFMFAEFRGSL